MKVAHAFACRQVTNTLAAAKRTLELMRELLAIHKHEDCQSLIDHVKEVGMRMIRARPQGAFPPPFCRLSLSRRLHAALRKGDAGVLVFSCCPFRKVIPKITGLLGGADLLIGMRANKEQPGTPKSAALLCSLMLPCIVFANWSTGVLLRAARKRARELHVLVAVPRLLS
jgi:hypothetical protein